MLLNRWEKGKIVKYAQNRRKMDNILSSTSELEYSEGLPSLEDAWILHQREKNCKIWGATAWLLDNLKPWFLEIGSGENLPKNREVYMSLYKQNRSRYYYINISYCGQKIKKNQQM